MLFPRLNFYFSFFLYTHERYDKKREIEISRSDNDSSWNNIDESESRRFFLTIIRQFKAKESDKRRKLVSEKQSVK